MVTDTINLKLLFSCFAFIIVSACISTYGQSGTVLKLKGGYIKGQWKDQAYMYQMHFYRPDNTSANSGDKVWMYRFDYARDSSGATHAKELPFVWCTIKGLENGNELQLAAAIHPAWAHFVQHQKPGKINRLTWPLYKADAKSIIVFDTSSHTGRLTNVFNDTALAFSGFYT